MLRDLRKNISDQIQIKQIRKQKLFDEISKIDSDLLELNEILVKIGTDDAFFRISPNEAFEILESLGYKDNKEKLEMYVSLLTNEDKKVEKKESKKESEKELNFDKYIKICEKNLKNNNISSEKNKKFKAIVKFLDENLDYDNYYYIVNGVKVGKFRLFYNLVNLFGEKYSDDEVLDVFKFAFCYKNVKDNDYNKVYSKLEELKNKLVKLV